MTCLPRDDALAVLPLAGEGEAGDAVALGADQLVLAQEAAGSGRAPGGCWPGRRSARCRRRSAARRSGATCSTAARRARCCRPRARAGSRARRRTAAAGSSASRSSGLSSRSDASIALTISAVSGEVTRLVERRVDERRVHARRQRHRLLAGRRREDDLVAGLVEGGQRADQLFPPVAVLAQHDQNTLRHVVDTPMSCPPFHEDGRVRKVGLRVARCLQICRVGPAPPDRMAVSRDGRDDGTRR